MTARRARNAETIDVDGLICAFAVRPGGLVRQLPGATLDTGADEWVWLHLDRSTPGTESWLRERSGLSQPLVDALLENETRPRHALFDGGALVILRGVNLNEGAEAHDMISLRVWVAARAVISLRRDRVFAIQDLRHAYEHACTDDTAEDDPATPTELLGAIVEGMTDRIAATVSELEDALDALEERFDEDDPEAIRGQILALRRRALPMKRYLAPQREALAAFARAQIGFISAQTRTIIAEEADRTVRLVEALDALRERAGLLQEEVAGAIADRMNRNTYTLSIVAAIFLPLGFLTGLLGINVGGMPGTDDPRAFWIVVLVCVVLTAGGAWLLKRLRLF